MKRMENGEMTLTLKDALENRGREIVDKDGDTFHIDGTGEVNLESAEGLTATVMDGDFNPDFAPYKWADEVTS